MINPLNIALKSDTAKRELFPAVLYPHDPVLRNAKQ